MKLRIDDEYDSDDGNVATNDSFNSFLKELFGGQYYDV